LKCTQIPVSLILKLATFEVMNEKDDRIIPIEKSVPFNGIFSPEQIKAGNKLFLKIIRQERREAMRILSQKSHHSQKRKLSAT
jgi:hypothetical protein